MGEGYSRSMGSLWCQGLEVNGRSSVLSLKKFFKGKRVFITGHTGFKGAWLSQWLDSFGAEVSGFSIGIPTKPSMFEALDLASRMEHNVGDINSLDTLKTALKSFEPNVVFHLAAQPLVRRSYLDPIETYQTNVVGTVNVLDVCRELDSLQSLVIVTTDKCYQNNSAGLPFAESDRLGGSDPYSASKACVELVYKSYYDSFFKDKSNAGLCSVRAGNVIGGGDWAVDRLVPDCVRSWVASESVHLRNPGHIRPWQHVLEPLYAYLLLAEQLAARPELSGESFNIGPSDSSHVDVEKVVSTLSSFWPESRWTKEVSNTSTLKESSVLKLDCSKADKLLGVKPTLSLEDALEWTAEWYRAYYNSAEVAARVSSEQISRYQGLLS